jgi:hypothetical protein
MAVAPLIVSAAESGSTSHAILVGGGVFVLLLLLMLGLLAFGAGRDHS